MRSRRDKSSFSPSIHHMIVLMPVVRYLHRIALHCITVTCAAGRARCLSVSQQSIIPFLHGCLRDMQIDFREMSSCVESTRLAMPPASMIA